MGTLCGELCKKRVDRSSRSIGFYRFFGDSRSWVATRYCRYGLCRMLCFCARSCLFVVVIITPALKILGSYFFLNRD